MKLNKKIFVLGTIFGILLFGSGVFAATYFSASDVSFTPNDEAWEVTNVKEAMDSLYTITQNLKNTNYVSKSYTSAEGATSLTINVGEGYELNKTLFYEVSNLTLTGCNYSNISFTATYSNGNLIINCNSGNQVKTFKVNVLSYSK